MALRRRSAALTAPVARSAAGLTARTARRTSASVSQHLETSRIWWFVLAAHPRQGLLTAAGMALTAGLIDRPAREVALVFVTVLVGQTVLGWHNDYVDRARDARHLAKGLTHDKPVADGRLVPADVWFALACAVLLLVPLSVSTGVTAGSCYLLSVGIGMVGNVAFRRGIFSWIPWALSFSLLPAYISFGGWGGAAEGVPPGVAMTLLAAALGVGVHFLRALFGLVADHQDGWTYWPLRLSMRLGATRMLIFTGAYLAAVIVAIIVVGATVGLRQ